MNNELVVSEEYIRAKDLDRKIKISAQLTQQSLYDMCMGFKEMRDSKLYKELGYSDFGDYCENETGMKRANVYHYIAIVERLPKDFVYSNIQIGQQKMYLLSTLTEEERTEITETTNLENTSVRELKEKISDLKKANERLMTKISEEQAKSQKLKESESKAYGKVSILETDNEFYRGKISQLESEIEDKNDNISTLESTIEELENRPIEVAVSETGSHEIENLKDAMKRIDLDWSLKYDELQEKTTKEVIENNKKHNAEIENLKAEYENKLKSVPVESVTDTKEIFRAYLSNAVDSAKRLMDFIRDNPDEFYIGKTKDFYSKIIEEL